jgi:hypothetical protein
VCSLNPNPPSFAVDEDAQQPNGFHFLYGYDLCLRGLPSFGLIKRNSLFVVASTAILIVAVVEKNGRGNRFLREERDV